jgi:hypothetical protein
MASDQAFLERRRFSADRIGMSENEAGRRCPVRRELASPQIDRGRKTWKPGVTRYFDQNVFKTKPETERSVSFICPGNDRAGRVDIVEAARLADQAIGPENNENT